MFKGVLFELYERRRRCKLGERKDVHKLFPVGSLQANLVFSIQKNSFCTSSHMSRHILIRGSRSRSYPPFSADIFQILVKVLLIIHTQEICAPQASPNGPREVVLEERFPLLLSKSGNHWKSWFLYNEWHEFQSSGVCVWRVHMKVITILAKERCIKKKWKRIPKLELFFTTTAVKRTVAYYVMHSG